MSYTALTDCYSIVDEPKTFRFSFIIVVICAHAIHKKGEWHEGLTVNCMLFHFYAERVSG